MIFICCFDPFDCGADVYFFEKYDRNSNLILNDGSYTIIVNTTCSLEDVSAELKPIIQYLQSGEFEEGRDSFVDDVHKKVMEINRGEDLVTIMTLEEELELRYDAGIKKGIEKGKIDTAIAMKQEGIDTELICKCTGLSMEQVKAL